MYVTHAFQPAAFSKQIALRPSTGGGQFSRESRALNWETNQAQDVYFGRGRALAVAAIGVSLALGTSACAEEAPAPVGCTMVVSGQTHNGTERTPVDYNLIADPSIKSYLDDATFTQNIKNMIRLNFGLKANDPKIDHETQRIDFIVRAVESPTVQAPRINGLTMTTTINGLSLEVTGTIAKKTDPVPKIPCVTASASSSAPATKG